jgi:hypothetical protein
MADSWDTNTLGAVKKIPLLTTRAGPRDGEEWTKRLKEEYKVPPSAASIVPMKGSAKRTRWCEG